MTDPDNAAGPPRRAPASGPAPADLSPKSVAAQAYYARVEQNYLAQDLLRTDPEPADAPFDSDDLARNFGRIAFYSEFAEDDGRLVPKTAESRLFRWERPIRVHVEFGASVRKEQRAADRAEIAAYVARLARQTGHPVRMTARNPNHTILILNADEREAARTRIEALAPGISEAAIRSVTSMSPDIYCTVFGFTLGESTVYTRALTVIRGELPDRMRSACIEEELAQSLGLVADHPHVRPSIFNDNEEFARLTRQDEMMLSLLYDPRLRPGMSLKEAWPIIQVMAKEKFGGDS